MKKNFFFLVLISVAALSIALAGCQKKASTANAATESDSPKDITVRLLTADTVGIDDKSYNAAAWRGILDFYGDTWNDAQKRGSAYDVITAREPDMYVPNLKQVTNEGHDLIVVTGFAWEAALTEVAKDNPQQKYMIVDFAGINSPNVMQAVYAEHEGSYLVGAATALKAKEDGITNPRFGFIGGERGSLITKFEVGYVQGILSIIPNAQIVDYYVNSWREPPLAKITAKNWYDSGVYAIYSAAGYSGNGTIAQAKEYRTIGKNVWAIGVDSDQHDEGLYTDDKSAVLTSMVKQVENSMVYALDAVRNSTFKGEVITFDLVKGGVGYAVTNPALSSTIVSQLKVINRKIIDGQIVVASTYADAKRLPGFPQDLKAVDD